MAAGDDGMGKLAFKGKERHSFADSCHESSAIENPSNEI
jgi:hypothetical protein